MSLTWRAVTMRTLAQRGSMPAAIAAM